ncbi:MAG: hypothetical protein AABY84_12475 [Candidatus Firestonebacteria bacterium]|mgnify:CR=1 FL=1
METKDIVYAVGIGLTFILGIWNLINNYLQTKKTNFINTVTKQRIEWSEQIRQDISKFCGLTYTWSFSNLQGKPDEQNVLLQIDHLRHIIKLRLNSNDTADKKITELVDKIPCLTDKSKHNELKEALRDLISETQVMLKAEWEKVKEESEKGNISKKRT